ncbi:hypothetical protein EU508_04330 [Pseudoalteromonas fuliginea]|uniref:KAP NTPase domain-containing protein n=1 Tax=Pseudoalteromonas fuliginea TaxID=1872678 RepID=A0AB73BJL7_9GAMM|nr:P-loop NTPase fold protein [Pseudoalteromonas fuliginea]KAA1163418.1 hypothetical protein EU508_04330 [Pseudoalteromonas fuliginea]
MSQVKTLPITATRWLSLLLCAITAATITVFLSKAGFVQKAYSSWSAILAANPVLHYSGAFLAGIGIKLLLDKFYISHPKRDIGFNWRYPPVTVSLWLSLIFMGFIFYFTSNQEELIAATSCFEYFIVLILGSSIITAYQQSNERISLNLVVCFSLIAVISTAFIYWHISQIGFSWPLFITVDIYIFSAIFLIIKYINECIKAKWNRNQITLERTKNLSSGDFKTLDQFKSWFKDDSTIKSTEELEPDLQVYAKRITERLQNGGAKYEKDLAQHIALCGPYGCGKSSIVESIVNDLAKNSEKESIWIHSDISTWGAASGNVAHVILSNIIDDISQYIDMCAFRTLPKHYTEALKSGGSMFQFASALLAGPVDIEGSFQKLNDVLKTTNHKLLITLQDVDRGTGDENEKRLNDIAALLDRLKDKNLSHINFIVAMGNENEVAAEVISKATDYREDIHKQNIMKFLLKFTEESILDAIELKKVIVIEAGEILYKEKLKFVLYGDRDRYGIRLKLVELENQIASIRELKKIFRRVNQIWQKGKLMGEVSFFNLMMLTTLREINIKSFERYKKLEKYNIKSLVSRSDYDLKSFINECAKDRTGEESLITFYIEMLDITADSVLNPAINHVLDNPSAKWQQHGSTKNQSVGFNNGYSDYLSRILSEEVPKDQVSDQVSIANVLELYKLKPSDTKGILLFINHFLSFSDKEVVNFERFFGLIDNKLDITDCIGKHFIERGFFVDYAVNNGVEEIFKKLLAESLTINKLHLIFDSFLSNNRIYSENIGNIIATEFLYEFLTFLGVTTSSKGTFSPQSLIDAIRSLNTTENPLGYTFFYTLLISYKNNFGVITGKVSLLDKINKVQVGDHTLGKLLVGGSLQSLPQLNKKQFMTFKHAEQLNKEIEQLTGKELIEG